MKNKPAGFIEPGFNGTVPLGIEDSLGAPRPEVAVYVEATASG